MTKKSKLSFNGNAPCLISGLITVGVMIWINVWAAVGVKRKLNSSMGLYTKITQNIRNWNLDFITDVEVVTSQTCSPGFELGFKGFWSGTVQGCDCRGIACGRSRGERNNSYKLSRGNCYSKYCDCPDV